MTKQFALSTFDNPFNPFTDYNSWLSFDKEKDYNSSERLMRVAKITEEMSDVEETIEIERAIDTIIKNDFLNIFIKVSQDLIPVEDD